MPQLLPAMFVHGSHVIAVTEVAAITETRLRDPHEWSGEPPLTPGHDCEVSIRLRNGAGQLHATRTSAAAVLEAMKIAVTEYEAGRLSVNP